MVSTATVSTACRHVADRVSTFILFSEVLKTAVVGNHTRPFHSEMCTNDHIGYVYLLCNYNYALSCMNGCVIRIKCCGIRKRFNYTLSYTYASISYTVNTYDIPLSYTQALSR
jgi:hypothetical protein